MKNFKHSLNRIYISLAASLLLFSLGFSSITGFARHVHRYRSRFSRRIIRRNFGRSGMIRFRRRRLSKRTRQRITNHQIERNRLEISRQTIKDINKDRWENHLPKLRVSRKLSKIGTERSYQLLSYFSHNTKRHPNEIQYLLNQGRIRYRYYGENIASSPLGRITALDVGPYDTPNDANPHKLTYHAKNGYQLANNINNASMYHDAGDSNGHRANDLDRHFKQMGVGVSYNNHDRNYYISIEFID